MKCPREKFKDLDYSQDIVEQKKAICQGCSEYAGDDVPWGEHCRASLTCLITGKRLGPEAIARLPKGNRESATHTISDEGRQEFIKRIERIKNQHNRPLW